MKNYTAGMQGSQYTKFTQIFSLPSFEAIMPETDLLLKTNDQSFYLLKGFVVCQRSEMDFHVYREMESPRYEQDYAYLWFSSS